MSEMATETMGLQPLGETDAGHGAGTVVKSPSVAPARAYLAFFRGKGTLFSKLIRWWTDSKYSHVELAFPRDADPMFACYSSNENEGGVRFKLMDLPGGEWDLVPVCKFDLERARAWAIQQVGKSYDWAGILGMVWRPRNDRPGRYFCSEFCLAALQAGDWSGGQGLIPARVDPGTLHGIAVAQARRDECGQH